MKRLDALLLTRLILTERLDYSEFSNEDLLKAAEDAVSERPYWTICNRHLYTWARVVFTQLKKNGAERTLTRYLTIQDRQRYLNHLFGEHYDTCIGMDISIDASHAHIVGMIVSGDMVVGPRTTRFVEKHGLLASIALTTDALRKFEVGNPQLAIELEKRARKFKDIPEEHLSVFIKENIQDNTKAPKMYYKPSADD